MQLCRGAHTVGESATFGGGFPRRTAPLSAVIALIPPWMGHHEFKQLLFRLPFFKRGSIRAENQKVWDMQSLGRATGWPLIVEFQLIRLIKKLQHLGIVLHCIRRPQFNRVTLKLDAHTHFPAGVGPADIQETPLDSASRRRRTKANEEVTRGSRKLEPITPLLKGEGLHALLLLIRSGPHGVLDTSARNDTQFLDQKQGVDAFSVYDELVALDAQVFETPHW